MKTKPWMRSGLFLGLFSTIGILASPAYAINLGDPEAAVIKELGAPQGRITSGKYDVYIYNRGKVELANGLVTSIELMSEEAAETRRLAKEKSQQEAEQQAKDTSERRRIEGHKVLADRLADPIFRAQPASGQLSYWDIFKKQYPEIDISSVYTDLSKQYETEQAQTKVQAQLADLQQRTDATEARVRRAEQAVEAAFLTPPPTTTYVTPIWTYSYQDSYYNQDNHYRRPTPATSPTRPCNVRPNYITTQPVPVTLAGAIAPSTRTIPTTQFNTYCNHSLSTGMPRTVKSNATCK